MKAKYELGDLLKDKVSGFKGIALSKSYYATGCVHFGLGATETTKDGGVHDWQWFDQSRLDLVKKQAIKFDLGEKSTSGAFPNPPSM